MRKKDSRQKHNVSRLQPSASSLHSDCNRLYGSMFLMPAFNQATSVFLFLCCFELKNFLIQPTWIIFASVCRCVSAVMGGYDGGVMADGCVNSCFSDVSSLHTSGCPALRSWGCVLLASVHNNGLTSLAALRSPAGFGGRATRNVGGSFFSSASLELFSTEQSPEDGRTNKKNDTTNGARGSEGQKPGRRRHITCCLKYRLSSSSTSTRLRK